ncbi:MAG TPA: peptidase dimerization domain-containing protein, partial [Thermomicrobiaceae bacterium]|nr:peptidase dimerization domain-containing protein [Thermomicrobiaceae bacterium]
AVELMNVGVNYMREHVIEKARIHYVIPNGGGAPNVVPDEAEVWYYVRAPERSQVEELTNRVRKIAEGATLMTETTFEEDFQAGCYNTLPNDVLAELAHELMEELGGISFTQEEQDYAQIVVNGYPKGTREAGIRSRGLPENILEQPLPGDVQPIRNAGQVGSGSTDVGDVSWIAPTVSVNTTCWPVGIPGHSWGIVACGHTTIGHKGMMHAAKAMALTGVELFNQPETLKKAQEEFKQRTAGNPYKCPIPDHVAPPLPVGYTELVKE